MSYDAVKWALDQKVTPCEKLVLVALAHYMNHQTSKCHPSFTTLAAKTGYSLSAVKKTVVSLKKQGILEITARFSDGGDRTSNGYKLIGVVSPVHGVVYEEHPRVVYDVHPNKELLEQRIEHTDSEGNDADASGLQDKTSIPFDDIIEAYHDNLPNLPRTRKLNPQIKSLIKARWKEDKKHRDVEFWKWFFHCVNIFPFYADPKGDWRPTLKWFLTASKFNDMHDKIEDYFDRQEKGQ